MIESVVLTKTLQQAERIADAIEFAFDGVECKAKKYGATEFNVAIVGINRRTNTARLISDIQQYAFGFKECLRRHCS